MFPRFNVLGIGVHAVCLRQTLTFLLNAASEKQKGYVCAADVQKIMEAQNDPDLRDILNSSLLTIADNCATACVGRVAGYKCLTPVDTAELMTQLCLGSAAHGMRHFFLGGAPGVAEEVKSKLLKRCPELQIVGVCSTDDLPRTLQEEVALIHRMRDCRPDFIWLGLESPVQERLMAKCIESLNSGIIVAAGSAFDVFARSKGDSRQMARNARRVAKGWLTGAKFAVLIIAQMLGLKHYPFSGRRHSAQPTYTLPKAA